MIDLQQYLDMRETPRGRLVMYQRWRSLLFLHFSLPPEEIQALLPPGLTVDTFPDAAGEERAWVGLVPFRMEGIRPRFVPTVPGTDAFPETNVRTYVHRDGRDPGVWFFSLDAANALACEVARRMWKLPYHEAQMSVTERMSLRTYRCARRNSTVTSRIAAKLGDKLPPAEPGTLEFFLVERYLLYAFRDNRLLKGRVWHRPYALQRATVTEYDDRLVKATGITPRPIEHVLYSPGVDCRIFGIEAV